MPCGARLIPPCLRLPVRSRQTTTDRSSRPSASRDDAALQVTISDNGKGIDAPGDAEGIGVIAMRERVYEFSGEFEVISGAQAGTTIVAKFPTAAPKDAA